jgi:hypothetical protein
MGYTLPKEPDYNPAREAEPNTIPATIWELLRRNETFCEHVACIQVWWAELSAVRSQNMLARGSKNKEVDGTPYVDAVLAVQNQDVSSFARVALKWLIPGTEPDTDYAPWNSILRPIVSNPPAPITTSLAWPKTPEAFRMEFSNAIHVKEQFHRMDVAALAQELANIAGAIDDAPQGGGSKKELNKQLKELQMQIDMLRDQLNAVSAELTLLGHSHKVFAVPDAVYPIKHLEHVAAQIIASFQAVSPKRADFNRNNFLGTVQQWDFFLAMNATGGKARRAALNVVSRSSGKVCKPSSFKKNALDGHAAIKHYIPLVYPSFTPSPYSSARG